MRLRPRFRGGWRRRLLIGLVLIVGALLLGLGGFHGLVSVVGDAGVVYLFWRAWPAVRRDLSRARGLRVRRNGGGVL
jgi:hypothetical protein